MSEALAAALAAEHAAIYAYGPIGVRLRGAAADQARSAEAAHRSRRDALVLLLTEGGGPVPAAAPAYALPFPVTDEASALRLAVEIEERTAAVWRAALPATEGPPRTRAVDGLTDAAVRATRWRKAAGVTPATVPFPGRPT
ncbi:ferritin-like domain-containing protein [Plantactinospora sp. WMMB334]|uniref:ferritin-like domain-containing protein n=1 Tax=Plantactinospora sp. WMMB334 TaxID=3404119 RepID=UPI003B928A13